MWNVFQRFTAKEHDFQKYLLNFFYVFYTDLNPRSKVVSKTEEMFVLTELTVYMGTWELNFKKV